MNKINEWILSLTPIDMIGYATCLAGVITIIVALAIYFFRRKKEKKQLRAFRKDIVEKTNDTLNKTSKAIGTGTVTAGKVMLYYQRVQEKQPPKFWKRVFDAIKYSFVKKGQFFKFLFSRKKKQKVGASNPDTRLSTTVISSQPKNPVKRFFGWCWKNIKTFFNWCGRMISRFGRWCVRTVKNITRWCVKTITGIFAWLWKAFKWICEYTTLAIGTLTAILLIVGFLCLLYFYNKPLGITAAILLLVTLYLFRKKIWREITGKNIVEDEVEEHQEPGTSFFKRGWVRLLAGTIVATMIIGAIIFSSALIDNPKPDNGKEQAEKVDPPKIEPKPLPGGGGKAVAIDYTWNAGRGSLTIPPGKVVSIGVEHGAAGHITTNGPVKRCNLAGTDCIEEIPVTLNRTDTIILSPDKIPFLLTNTGSSDVTISYYLHL